MKKILSSKPICGKPVQNFFSGRDKYLRIQKHLINDITPPISEFESLFILVGSGRGLILINGVEFPLEVGSFIWLQSYHTYTIRAFPDDPLELDVCVYDYPLSSFLALKEPSPEIVSNITDAPPLIQLANSCYREVRGLFNEFELENDDFGPGSSLIKVSILGQLSEIFIRQSMRLITADYIKTKPLGWKAILYMSVNFSDDISAESVAKHFSTTTSFLNRELRNITGYNFNQILSRIRVNIASMALLYRDVPLSNIVEHSGFSTEVDFYRSFKRQTGFTPIEYRNSCLSDGEDLPYRGMIMQSTLMDILNHAYSSYSLPVNITTTAKSLFVSDSIVRELVQKKFDMTFKDIIYLNRLRHAEAQLLISDFPIVDIAINVGFNSARSLTRIFQKTHGMTPGEYRLQNKGGHYEFKK